MINSNFIRLIYSLTILQSTGEVELENVPLKKDVLDKLGLPIQIHAGFVGKICFQIPLTKIRSEPWVISFEQLYLVAGPKDKNEVNNTFKFAFIIILTQFIFIFILFIYSSFCSLSMKKQKSQLLRNINLWL